MAEEKKLLACASCGSEDLWAWYPDPVRQTIEVWLEDGEVQLEYTGITKSGDDAGDNDAYTCGGCGIVTETVEELVGQPLPPLLGRSLSEWEVLGMLIGDADDSDVDFPSGADFIDAVCQHFGFSTESYARYIKLRKANEQLLAEMRAE